MDPDWQGMTELRWMSVRRAIAYSRPPVDRRRKRRRVGRPPVPDRTIVNALIWAIGGGTLDRLPKRFGSRRTVLRRLAHWERYGVVELLWQFYIDPMAPQEVCEWWLLFKRRREPIPYYQYRAMILFRSVHRDPFTRLASCQPPSPPAAPAAPAEPALPAASPPP